LVQKLLWDTHGHDMDYYYYYYYFFFFSSHGLGPIACSNSVAIMEV